MVFSGEDFAPRAKFKCINRISIPILKNPMHSFCHLFNFKIVPLINTRGIEGSRLAPYHALEVGKHKIFSPIIYYFLTNVLFISGCCEKFMFLESAVMCLHLNVDDVDSSQMELMREGNKCKWSLYIFF